MFINLLLLLIYHSIPLFYFPNHTPHLFSPLNQPPHLHPNQHPHPSYNYPSDIYPRDTLLSPSSHTPAFTSQVHPHPAPNPPSPPSITTPLPTVTQREGKDLRPHRQAIFWVLFKTFPLNII